jgi:hypothetical protein
MFTSRTLALAVVGLLALTAAHGRAQKPKDKADPPPLPNEAQVMQVKLKRAQALLEALTREDYKGLEEAATSLARISDATAFLRAYKTEEYEFQARVFKKTAEALAAKAKDKNLDGATLAYADMTLSCVKCHNYFRGKKRD